MREIIELQTGQVAFISSLMSGFALSIAVHVLRQGKNSRVAQCIFILFLIASLLFIMALYVDVRLSIELTGYEALPDTILSEVREIRNFGTSCATIALFVFIVATGLMGWVASPGTGVISTLIVIVVLTLIWLLRQNINTLSLMLLEF